MKTELYHHGVKGQKWGVRRYQNPDGTLTAAGRKRYLELTKPIRDWEAEELKEIGVENYTLKKGGTITRASVKGEELSDRRIYAAILESDIDEYARNVQGGTLGRLTNVNAEDCYQITYEALKDLKIATIANQEDFYIEENSDKTLKEFFKNIPEKRLAGLDEDSPTTIEFNKLMDRYGDVPIGKFKEDVKLQRDRIQIANNTDDVDNAVLRSPGQIINYWAKYVMMDDILENTQERNDYFSEKHEQFLDRMGKAGWDAFVDLEDGEGFTRFPLIVTNPNTKFKVQSKINFRQKRDEEELDSWRSNPRQLKRAFKDKRLRGGALNTMGNVWYKMTDAEKKQMTKPIPRKWKKWIPTMDQFTDYRKEHPNSDMQFSDYVAMIQKSKESKK